MAVLYMEYFNAFQFRMKPYKPYNQYYLLKNHMFETICILSYHCSLHSNYSHPYAYSTLTHSFPRSTTSLSLQCTIDTNHDLSNFQDRCNRQLSCLHLYCNIGTQMLLDCKLLFRKLL